MRALKIATIVMGVLILGGTGILLTLLAKRGTSAPAPVLTAGPTDIPGEAGIMASIILDEPAGSRIVSMIQAEARLALLVQGGGADRIVFVNMRTGKVAGRISLKQ